MTDETIYLKIVKSSPLMFKMKSIAQQFFSLWKEGVAKKYSNFLFQADLEIMAEDMLASFAKGLCCLFKEKNKKSRRIPGWSIGYIFGFVSSDLCTHWCHRYIYSETDEYKRLMFIKAVILYLDFDHVICKKLENLYKYLVHIRTDIAEKKDTQQEKIVFLEHFKLKNNHEKFQKLIISYLESVLIEKHHIIFDEILEKCEYPELELFFTQEEIANLIQLSDNRVSRTS